MRFMASRPALGGVLGAGLGGRDGAAYAGLQLGADRLVALAALLVLAVALDLALDVGHGVLLGSDWTAGRG